jgi:hypothetical protein
MSVAHALWFDNLVRSSLQCDVAFSPSAIAPAWTPYTPYRLQKRTVRVSTTGHQGSQYLKPRLLALGLAGLKNF